MVVVGVKGVVVVVKGGGGGGREGGGGGGGSNKFGFRANHGSALITASRLHTCHVACCNQTKHLTLSLSLPPFLISLLFYLVSLSIPLTLLLRALFYLASLSLSLPHILISLLF